MGINDLFLLVSAAFISLYALCCSLQCGLALSAAWPRLTNTPAQPKDVFRPIWQLVHLFMILGVTTLAFLFNNAAEELRSPFLPLVFIALLSLLSQACLAGYTFYYSKRTPGKLILWLFTIFAFTTPLTLAAAGAYLLTGQHFWHSIVGTAIMAAAFFGLSATGLLILNHRSRISVQAAGELLLSVWLLILGCVIPLTVIHGSLSWQASSIGALVILSLACIGIVAYKMLAKGSYDLWKIGVLLCLATPFIFALANKPYLLAGKIRLDDTLEAQSSLPAVVAGMLLLLILAAFAIWKFINPFYFLGRAALAKKTS